MKLVLTALLTLTLLGCSGESARRTPSAPDPPAPPAPTSLASFSGMVLDESGACIVGATVQVVRGQQLGQSITQTTPCSYWDYDEGFRFTDLTPGVEMTLRASAPGFVAQEATVVPSGGPQERAFITLLSIE